MALEGLSALEHQHVPCLMGEETLDGDLLGGFDGCRVHHDGGAARPSFSVFAATVPVPRSDAYVLEPV